MHCHDEDSYAGQRCSVNCERRPLSYSFINGDFTVKMEKIVAGKAVNGNDDIGFMFQVILSKELIHFLTKAERK